MQHQGRNKPRSAGGRYYRAHPLAEYERKRSERARLASAVYGFIQIHPEYAGRWHPIYNPVRHSYRLTAKEEADWRRFLREHNWNVPEKGRANRIRGSQPRGRIPRPLTAQQEAARERFRSEGLGRAPESYRGIYNA